MYHNGHGAGRKSQSPGGHVTPPLPLRFAAKILYELCLGVFLCLTKPAFMRRPWLGISGFHGHNSTASKLLRYSRPRECDMPARTLRLTPLTLWMVLIFIISASYYKRHRKLLYRSYCIITVLFFNN